MKTPNWKIETLLTAVRDLETAVRDLKEVGDEYDHLGLATEVRELTKNIETLLRS